MILATPGPTRKLLVTVSQISKLLCLRQCFVNWSSLGHDRTDAFRRPFGQVVHKPLSLEASLFEPTLRPLSTISTRKWTNIYSKHLQTKRRWQMPESSQSSVFREFMVNISARLATIVRCVLDCSNSFDSDARLGSWNMLSNQKLLGAVANDQIERMHIAFMAKLLLNYGHLLTD